MHKSIKEMIERRITNPNNATSKFCDYLKHNQVSIAKETRMRKTAIIDSKRYAITITGSDNDMVECRQFNNEDGIITFWERNGQVYIIEKQDVLANTQTREMSGKKYKNAQVMYKFESITPTNKINQLNENLYVESYLNIAQNVADNMVNNAIRKFIK